MVYQKFYLYVKIKLILFSPDILAPEYVLFYCVKKKHNYPTFKGWGIICTKQKTGNLTNV